MRRLCATVLIMEAVVIGLAIPVAIAVGHANPRMAGIAGGSAAVAAVLLAAFTVRGTARWPIALGSVLQAVVIAGGVVVPVMYFLGAIFAALWVTAIWLGYRVEHGLRG